MDCYTLALDGFNIVLRVQWLRYPRPIYWDLSKLAMTFWHRDHHVMLHGEAAPGARAASCDGQDLLEVLLNDFAFLFASHMDCHHPAHGTTASISC